jgi:two-component system chemotaxis response regulator CheY
MRKILIVDDSPILRHMVLEALRTMGDVSFEQAANGLEAIERLALSHFDLMTLDLNMPDMHGLEVLQFVRQQPAHAALPILVLTTKGDEETRQAALQAGAASYVTKPFSPEVVVREVRALLEKRNSFA